MRFYRIYDTMKLKWMWDVFRDCLDAMHTRELRMLGGEDFAIIDETWFQW
jgi:hypothetical protein